MKKLRSIEKKCAEYLSEEPDANLRAEITALLEKDAEQELTDRIGNHLGFGTAGLRAKMEAGYNRMNKVSVYRFSYALGRELSHEQKESLIVIGFDAREHSETFALESAFILSMMGIAVHLFESFVPTPLCAYAVRKLKAKAGVMITASHNPYYDNGIKLFNHMGAQAHGRMLTRIENHMPLAPLRVDFIRDHAPDPLEHRQAKIGDELFSSYLRDIKGATLFTKEQMDLDIPIVYTPLHGVGKYFFLKALKQECFDNVFVVPEQSEPDGRFPTVIFPNPEEKNTLDLAHAYAHIKESVWVFANDPDADRLQVSCLDPLGQFKKLSGNEMGSILGYFAILKAKEKGIKPLLASSIVSSRMLRTICDDMGAQYVDALTGFSNIVDAALKIEAHSDYQFVFAYEEAIGFLVGQVVLDKDGINAGVRFMEIAGYLVKARKTIWQFLDELYLSLGIFVNDQWSIRFDGINPMAKMKEMMDRVRSLSSEKLASCFDRSECEIYDLQKEQRESAYIGMNANVMIFELSHLFRLIIRPSGTEPKIKFYLELFDHATDQCMLSKKKLMLRQKIEEIRNKIECILI